MILKFFKLRGYICESSCIFFLVEMVIYKLVRNIVSNYSKHSKDSQTLFFNDGDDASFGTKSLRLSVQDKFGCK